MNVIAKIPKERRRQIAARDIKVGDVLIRFGWPLTVIGVEVRKHPLGSEMIAVTHEKATVCYVPASMVEVQA